MLIQAIGTRRRDKNHFRTAAENREQPSSAVHDAHLRDQRRFREPRDSAAERVDGSWRAYYKALIDAGIYVGGAPLEAPATGATVRVHGGQRRVQDGPYADTKEQLGGQIVLELPSMDEALDWAARCPTAASGAVEVRALSPTVRSLVENGHS